MSREITNSEAIANLNHIYGMVSPNIQRSLDVAFKALEEKPQGEGFWVKEENESYCFDPQTGDLVLRVRYHCSECNGSGDNKDKFCKHCGIKMKGGAE